MNILILNWKDIKHPEVGGAEIIVYELAKRLVKDGHSVTWYCRRFANSSESETIEGIHVVRRGNLLTTYLLAPFYYWSLKQKPDVIYDISNTIFWQTPLWARRSKKVAYLNQLAKDVFYYEYPRIISRLGIFLEKMQYITYKSTQFICYANSTKKDLVSIGIPDKNIKLFSLGLDHVRYVPGKKTKDPLFICVSRLVKMKRTDLAIQAMKLVIQRHPEAKLVIIGTGYDRFRLQEIRDNLALKDNVIFADEGTWFFAADKRDKKVAYMQQAWALLFLSVKEGWGMTVTECAACGTPAIVTRVTGLVDSVVEKKTGIVVSEHPSPQEVANAIERVIVDKVFRTTVSKNAIANAKKYTWDQSYREFISASLQ